MSSLSVDCALIGVPLDLGSGIPGAASGPRAFRQQQILPKLTQAGLQITDTGDIGVGRRTMLLAGQPKLRYLDEIVRASEVVAGTTAETLRQGKRIISVGGDHCVSLGTFSGAATVFGDQIGLIYIDAHPDLNTAGTTLTGNIHGMSLSALLGFGSPKLTHIHDPQTKLPKENLLLIGISDCDKAELDMIKREQLKTFTLLDLLSHGLSPLLKMIDDLSTRLPNIWISLDLDAIDRAWAAGVSMPNDRGLTYREITVLAEYIGSHCKVMGVDIVEYNPLNDDDHQTAELGITLIASLLNRRHTAYTDYLNKTLVG